MEGGSSTALTIRNTGDGTGGGTGLRILNKISASKISRGIYLYPDNNTITGCNTYGIHAVTGYSTKCNIGIFGGVNTSYLSSDPWYAIGICGSSGTGAGLLIKYRGSYAGFFNGDVRVTGTLYATMLTPTENSTSAVASLNTETGVMQSNGIADGVSDRLSQVSLLQFHREQEVESSENKKTITKKSTNLLLAEEDIYEEDEVATDEAVPQTQLATVQYGLAADQLREVYPELVYEDQNGNVSINYIEMIPLLVQANNELRARVQALEDEKKGAVMVKEKMTEATPSQGAEDATLLLSLGQNEPNPFSEQTSIEVSVPESVTSVALLIFDMQGKQVKRIDISDRGTSRITVMGQGLPEGMYLYSLVADGKVVKTRKMILSK